MREKSATLQSLQDANRAETRVIWHRRNAIINLSTIRITNGQFREISSTSDGIIFSAVRLWKWKRDFRSSCALRNSGDVICAHVMPANCHHRHFLHASYGFCHAPGVMWEVSSVSLCHASESETSPFSGGIHKFQRRRRCHKRKNQRNNGK